mmetsp:Transcript_59971/g.106710  ORF Transcript_59971/g.106710 Transcript_59971/m.106710 type:complete len:987 (-) Transcript_59971:46-3006(-)
MKTTSSLISVISALAFELSDAARQNHFDKVLQSEDGRSPDDMFDCDDGQGEPDSAVRMTGDMANFEACGKLCLETENCEAFDFTEDRKSGHMQMFGAFGWVHDACRLYEKTTHRPSPGLQKRRFCKKLSTTGNFSFLQLEESGQCKHECGASSVIEQFYGEDLTFKLGEGDHITWEVTENTCMSQCVVLKKGLVFSPACMQHLEGSVKVSSIQTEIGNFKLCCTTSSCSAALPTDRDLVHPELVDDEELKSANLRYDCVPGQGPVSGAFSESQENSFENCSARCDAEEGCMAFDYTENQRSGHVENFRVWQHDACRLYKKRTHRKAAGLSERHFCMKVFEESEEAAEEEELPTLVGASSPEGVCQHPCGAEKVDAVFPSGESLSFSIGEGERVSYQPSESNCLGQCQVVTKRGFHSSCDSELKGSAKVAATGKFKLCCMPLSCPATTVTITTTETTLSLEGKFECRAGQGKAGTTYSESADSSFEACAARCDEDDTCAAFDYTVKEDSGHLELIGAQKGWVLDACRLYKESAFRPSEGVSNRQFCAKTVDEESQELDTTKNSAPKMRKKAVLETEELPRLVGAGPKKNVCQYACGAASVEAIFASGEVLNFAIGNGDRVSYLPSEAECLGECQIASKGLFHSSCDSTLEGSTKVAATDTYKLCCMPLACPATTTSTATTTPSLEAKFGCKAGQGMPATTYSESGKNSFEACAEHCDEDAECAAFDYSTDADSGHLEIFGATQGWMHDACRLYKTSQFRASEGFSKRRFCSKAGAEKEPEAEKEEVVEVSAPVGLAATAGGQCSYPCGLTSMNAQFPSGKTLAFAIGEGDRVSYSPTDAECLGQCVGVSKTTHHSSCESALKGSTKVAATNKWKMCCLVQTCPTTTTFTESATTEPPVTFQCQPGQGKAATTYRESGDNSFEACASRCEEDDECSAFDYTTDAKTGHVELFGEAKGWVRDACRLYKTAESRGAEGKSQRQHCVKARL